MIKLMVVAGKVSNSLADFLGKRGTFEVTHVYNSFKENMNDIQSKIIKVDKMLYLYNSEVPLENTDIRSEMKALSTLLKESSYFDIGEIIFVVRDTPDSDIAIKYFRNIVEASNYSNYAIKAIKGNLTYEVVYNSIMGITAVQQFKNSYTKLYQTGRNTEAELAYAELDDYDALVSNYDGSTQREYEAQRELLTKSASKDVIVGSSEIIESQNIDLNPVNIDKRAQKKIVVITGYGKSGKSIWGTVFGVSGIQSGKKVLILDVTDNKDIYTYAGNTNTECNPLSYKELVEGPTDNFALCEVDKDMVTSTLAFVTEKDTNFDLILTVVEPEVAKSLQAVKELITNTVVLTGQRECDIRLIESLFPSMYGSKVLIVNNNFTLFGQEKLLDKTKLREVVPLDIRVIMGKHFDSLDVDSKYFDGVIK